MGHILAFMDDYSFWVAQIFGIIAMVIGYLRAKQADRRQYYLYHTYLCVPLMIQFGLLEAWFMFSLCFVGSIRTLLLSTDWGFENRVGVVVVCLVLPTVGSFYSASHVMDWVLLFATIVGVGGEALKSFLHVRLTAVFCTASWLINSFVFGAYVNVLTNIATLLGQWQALNRDFAMMLRIRAFCGCQKSKLAYLQVHGATSY